MILGQFSTQDTLASAAIRWQTWSDWSHFDWVLPAGTLYTGPDVGGLRRGESIGGRWLGARAEGGVLPRVPYPVARSVRLALNIPTEALTFTLAQIGKPYDWTAIAGILVRRDWHEEDSWDCSELGAATVEPWVPVFGKFNRITPERLLLGMRAYQAGVRACLLSPTGRP